MNETQKKFLRGLCHPLKCVVQMGNKGLSATVMHEIATALDHHELIKIKLGTGDRQQKKAMIEKISTKMQAITVQTIGHVACFYRPNPDKQVIQLPKGK